MIVSVCGSVYLSASISPELRIKSPPFLRLLKLAVTWSSWQACDTLCTCVYGWRHVWTQWQECTHTHTHRFNRPFSGTTRVSRYQKGKTNLDFTEARDSEWQWHLLGHMQDCTVLQTDNHASTPPLSFLQSGALPAAQRTASRHWRHYWQEYTALNAYTQSDTAGGSTDLTLRHVLKLTHRGAAQVWVWSLVVSAVALLLMWVDVCGCALHLQHRRCTILYRSSSLCSNILTMPWCVCLLSF